MQPLRGAVDGGGQPGRAAADDHQIVEGTGRLGLQPDLVGDLPDRWRFETGAVAEDEQRQMGAFRSLGLDHLPRFGIGFDVEPPVRDLIAGQEVAHLVRGRRPAEPENAQPAIGRAEPGSPLVEQVVEDRVEVLLRRVPGLEQVVIETDGVDGPDRGFGVGVGGQQHALGVGDTVPRLLQKLDPGHVRHPLVGEQERDRFVAPLQFVERVEGRVARLGADHPVVAAVMATQVALDGAQHLRIVVDGQQRRPDRGLSLLHGACTPPY